MKNMFWLPAHAGNADAQYMAAKLSEPADIDWLEQAAENSKNHNVSAGIDVAKFHEAAGNFNAARKYMSIAAKPRGEFLSNIVVRNDGLRWRDQRTSRERDFGWSYGAAMRAAGMKMAGFGGREDFKSAKADIVYTQSDGGGWAEAEVLALIQHYKGKNIPANEMIEANLKALEKNSSNSKSVGLSTLLSSGAVEYYTGLSLL